MRELKTTEGFLKLDTGEDRPSVVEEKAHIGFILDCSSSMTPWVDQTIRGFNSYLNVLRTGDLPEVSVTFGRFSSDVRLKPSKHLRAILPLNRETYKPYGMTALYDAIIRICHQMEDEVDDDTNVTVVIQTDGQDTNSECSVQYCRRVVQDFMERGWKFILIWAGSEQDALELADDLGIPRDCVMGYDFVKSLQAFEAAGRLTVKASKTETKSEAVFQIEDRRSARE